MNIDLNDTKPAENNDNIDFNQMLLLDKGAYIVESCDSLFSTTDLKDKPVLEWSPFVESMFSYLISLKAGTPEVLFSRVEQPNKNLKGFYDFTFAPVSIKGNKYILWTIYDYTTLYTELQVNQQKRHELEIQKQNLNNRIYNIIVKNLSLKTKQGVTQEKTPLLLKANNFILKSIVADLDNINPFFKTAGDNYHIHTFSLSQLIQDLVKKIRQSSDIDLSFDISNDPFSNIIGDDNQVKYILYELLTLSNTKEGNSVKLAIDFNKKFENEYQVTFKITNQRLRLSNQETKDLGNEISLEEPVEYLFRLKIILKLILLQNGFIQSITCQDNQSIIQFGLTYRISEI